ncbi:hypothetical protein G4Y79_21015 [Phototrophicus methaneseepsis]|uniref:Uncharacterized protein n=1 Tax=Phototrophicus methaneseepsis TaxID=2710758 RepID=A0A7S8IE76_9CHLR|nr:hypothetical protein [Phototrophicus methaneseepsis]QPC82139.1 hypothetical protein G4Y79_21015 [Phototrophicus methaneseepsis]
MKKFGIHTEVSIQGYSLYDTNSSPDCLDGLCWMRFLSRVYALLRWSWRYGLALAFFALLFLVLVPRSTILINDKWQAIAWEVSPYQFDYIGWEANAIAAKADQVLFGQHAFMDEATRSQFVRDYMSDLSRANQLEGQIAAIYTDPNIGDAALASVSFVAERDALRADLAGRQSTAEAILEGQVAAVLVDEGFGLLGQLLPPMAMRFTQVPMLLVTSPRDAIRMETSINLYALPIDEIDALEARIDDRYEVSSLIVPLGGIALYPALILETTSITWSVETFAHEWLHHYLMAFPLGLHYITDVSGFAGDARTINETTADLFGREVGALVIKRYYPELVPPEPEPVPPDATPTPSPQPDPNAFDFAAEMNETRVTVDELLAAGDVEEAERYMEARRQFFYEHGYGMRKLNQAYFAFYGGYQAGAIPGVGGQDPVGPAIRTIRDSSPSLHDFVVTMRELTTREQLLTLAAQYPGVP